MRFNDIGRQSSAVHGEAVVHGRDLDLAGHEVLHRVIGPVVTLVHLDGLGSDGDAEHLVAEADAEGGDIFIDDVADHRHGIFACGRRIAGPIGEENTVRLEREDVCGGRMRRHHSYLAAVAGKLSQNVALDPIVDGDHVELRGSPAAVALAPFPAGLVPFEPLPRGHHGHEVHADEARPFTRLLLQELQVESSGRRVGDDRVGHALDADEARERPRVHAAQPDHAACLEPFVEVTRCAIVRRRGDGSAENDPARSGRRGHVDGFDVFLVRPHVADMRECESDDLAGIGGIGENFLIAGHGGIEADLPDRMPDGAKAEAFEHGPIGEHEQCGRLRLDPCALRLPMLQLFVVLRGHRSRLFPCSAGRSRSSPQSRRP
jgi:hypothetical protein